MDTVALWSAYVEWLRENVPRAHENLAPGATDAQIAEVERVTGLELPEAAKRVWRMNDGQRETMIASTRGAATPCIPTLSFSTVPFMLATACAPPWTLGEPAPELVERRDPGADVGTQPGTGPGNTKAG
ncbi:MAG: hypothetical protein ACK6CU_10765 [Deltaproteobacteria bacterium]|jgi:hypothetical protein